MADITVEKTAKTVVQAIALALEDLKATEEQVEIEVLEEGGKALLRIGKNKEARVRVTLRDNRANTARAFLESLLDSMDVEARIQVEEDAERIQLDMESNYGGLLIGRRGETIDAIQYLVGLVANRNRSEYKKVVVDAEGYWKKREQSLQKLAVRMAAKAEHSGRIIFLEPMNPSERRIIHTALQQNKNVVTYSVGEEPSRKVVIKPVQE